MGWSPALPSVLQSCAGAGLVSPLGKRPVWNKNCDGFFVEGETAQCSAQGARGGRRYDISKAVRRALPVPSDYAHVRGRCSGPLPVESLVVVVCCCS